MTLRKASYRPLRNEDEVMDRMNELLRDGFSLESDIKGEILTVLLAPNETKIMPHGLRTTPLYRLILRQTGNGVVTDVDVAWTEQTVGFKNESANSLVLKIKIFPG